MQKDRDTAALSPPDAEPADATRPATSRAAGRRDASRLNDALRRLANGVGAATRWRRRFIALLAGVASMLAMAPFHAWPVLFLTLPVAIMLLDRPPPTAGTRWRAAFHDGWWFGFGYHLFGLFWIGEAFLVEAHIFGWLLPFAVTLMPAGLALFMAASFALASLAWRPGVSRLFALAIAIALGEFLRGHIFTGFPWNVLGYALTNDVYAMQAAAIFGIYGLTLWAVLIFAAPLTLLRDFSSLARAAVLAVALSLVPLAAIYLHGVAVLPSAPLPTLDGVTIRIVQPSVPQADKWARDKQAGIFSDHLLLTRTAPDGRIDGAAGITHVVWPEAAMPFLPLATPRALEMIGETLPEGTRLIAGALRLEQSQVGDEVRPSVAARSRVFNSILVFDDAGRLITLYDKLHLVPFGEYLPFTETLEAIGLEALTRIRGGFATGTAPRPLLDVPGLPPIGPLICYEAIFPAAVIQGDARPGVLVNVTNDGWFGNLTGPFQHFHQSRLRAVEEGLPLIRAANNGVSALIDPYGRVVARIGLNVRGSVDVALPGSRPPGLYAMIGELSFCATLFCFGLVGCIAMAYPFAPGRLVS